MFHEESYEYIVFVADVAQREATVTKEIARLSAACRVNSYVTTRVALLL
jgi:hypothetical protein